MHILCESNRLSADRIPRRTGGRRGWKVLKSRLRIDKRHAAFTNKIPMTWLNPCVHCGCRSFPTQAIECQSPTVYLARRIRRRCTFYASSCKYFWVNTSCVLTKASVAAPVLVAPETTSNTSHKYELYKHWQIEILLWKSESLWDLYWDSIFKLHSWIYWSEKLKIVLC